MGRVQEMFSDLPWVSFKEFVDTRGCNIQWVDVKGAYYLMAKDGDIVAECFFNKETPIPTDQKDFEDNYKSVGNKTQAAVNKTTGAIKVAVEKSDESSTTLISHDWCDPSSWFTNSERVVDKVLTFESGLIHSSGDVDIIDLTHGRVTDEDEFSSSYLVELKDNDVVIIEDKDYTVDYKTGKFTLDVNYSKQGELKATYSKATDSVYIYEPKPGKILVLEHPELNFSKDCFINVHIDFEVWVGNPYFDPEQPIVEYDPDVPGLENCLRLPYKKKVYKNEKDLVNAANLGQGFIPQFGNLPDDVLVFPFNYVTTTNLRSTDLAQLRLSLGKNKDGEVVPLTGSYGTVSFYVISLNN